MLRPRPAPPLRPRRRVPAPGLLRPPPLLPVLSLLLLPGRAMVAPREAPLGEWESPITSELITSKVLRLSAPTLLSEAVTWIESRPGEGGRSVLVARSAADDAARDVTPGPDSAGQQGWNVRTRVQEYGGGEHLVTDDGRVFFSNFADQRVYMQGLAPGAAPRALTAEGSGQRFAGYALDGGRGRLLAVCEDHSAEGQEAVNTLAAIDLASGAVTQLVGGHDFFSAPALSPDGRRLAWVAWDHPNMPWDETALYVADLGDDGSVLGEPRQVAGGAGQSVQQPRWGPDGALYYVGDASGWWNLYRLPAGGGEEPAKALLPMAAEFGQPPWLVGQQSYQVIAGGAAVVAVFDDPAAAGSQLGVVDTAASALTVLDTGFTSFGRLCVAERPGGGLSVVTTAGSASAPQAVVQLTVRARPRAPPPPARAARTPRRARTAPAHAARRAARAQVPDLAGLLASGPGDWGVLKLSAQLDLDPGYLSAPSRIEFPTANGRTAFMNFYPPTNKDFAFPPGERPALLVKIHGGPTSAASTALALSYQFWTSRGFAIADVDYGGSTGLGVAYRNRLRGQWGVVDVDDVCNAARHLAGAGLVDGRRLCIDGGSAGGFTTLAALAFRDVFQAGASHYGVADAELLAQHTHKFESRYLDSLIGPYPEAKEIYRERSPIHAVDRVTAACAIFQGDEDAIVPPEQAEVMWRGLKANGVPTTLMMFKGEQHGFRKAPSIRAALEGELHFYGRVLGFPSSYDPALQPMTIDNLPGGGGPGGEAAHAAAAPGGKDELSAAAQDAATPARRHASAAGPATVTPRVRTAGAGARRQERAGRGAAAARAPQRPPALRRAPPRRRRRRARAVSGRAGDLCVGAPAAGAAAGAAPGTPLHFLAAHGAGAFAAPLLWAWAITSAMRALAAHARAWCAENTHRPISSEVLGMLPSALEGPTVATVWAVLALRLLRNAAWLLDQYVHAFSPSFNRTVGACAAVPPQRRRAAARPPRAGARRGGAPPQPRRHRRRRADALVEAVCQALFHIDAVLLKVYALLTVAFITGVLVRWKTIALEFYLLRRQAEDEAEAAAAAAAGGARARTHMLGTLDDVERLLVPLDSVSSWLAYLAAALVCAQLLGVNLAPLLAVGGVSSIMIGLGTQQLLQNTLMGLSLFLTRPFVAGDSVTLQSGGVLLSGVVEAVTPMRTTLRTDDDAVLTIPNKTVADMIIFNRSTSLSRSRLAKANRRAEALKLRVKLPHASVPRLPELQAAIEAVLCGGGAGGDGGDAGGRPSAADLARLGSASPGDAGSGSDAGSSLGSVFGEEGAAWAPGRPELVRPGSVVLQLTRMTDAGLELLVKGQLRVDPASPAVQAMQLELSQRVREFGATLVSM
ncbi:dapb3 [Scenedesmus sp. PABB004]|nr:dapb3 [Scenedesmus sp. PABB004]